MSSIWPSANTKSEVCIIFFQPAKNIPYACSCCDERWQVQTGKAFWMQTFTMQKERWVNDASCIIMPSLLSACHFERQRSLKRVSLRRLIPLQPCALVVLTVTRWKGAPGGQGRRRGDAPHPRRRRLIGFFHATSDELLLRTLPTLRAHMRGKDDFVLTGTQWCGFRIPASSLQPCSASLSKSRVIHILHGARQRPDFKWVLCCKQHSPLPRTLWILHFILAPFQSTAFRRRCPLWK